MRFQAVEEFVRRASGDGPGESETRRRLYLWDTENNFVSGDWLQWLPLIIQILEIVSEWLSDTTMTDETRDLCRAVEMMPTPERLKDLVDSMKSKGE
jgi:hypothetical protein